MENQIFTAVAEIGNEHYLTQLTNTRGHNLVADEPSDVGGTDQGPRPGDFVRMGLAACTAITLRMYADRKNWPVEKIKVKVSNAPFDGRKTVFHTEIEITGKVDEDQRARLLQIAKLCPVHKMLTNPIETETTLTVV
ncbi:MAG: OsmC family protein [Cyclobacteriaceae bacterium]|nr:OsmC family protein [Cyclobacteriaceae bacterium]